MNGQDLTHDLIDQVKAAADGKQPLRIVGNNSKSTLGRATQGEPIKVGQHQGILDYDPRELVLTARAGTPLAEIETTLANANQMLAFEPPHFGNASLGGTIACGLSGPRRPYAGSARDFVLGCKLLNGKGDVMRFGGQVMKNVAGYDISRLMAGSYGTLGILLDISLKVLPKPAATTTQMRECSVAEALALMNKMRSKPLPIDAACYYHGQLYLRLSGSEHAVQAALTQFGGAQLNPRSHFWQRLRELQLSMFNSDKPLWRIMVKPGTAPIEIDGEWLLDWGGGQRWLLSDWAGDKIRQQIAKVGGHATQFRGGDRNAQIFEPLPAALMALQKRIKQSFDPAAIFNPGRIYQEL